LRPSSRNVTPTSVAADRYHVFNGVLLRYRDQGSGPPVILLHGWTLALEMWNPQVEALRNRFRVISIDRRGFGLSAGHPSIDRDCEDLGALCKFLRLKSVALVGMSQGARAVMRFASSAATPKVRCVVLDGPPDLLGTVASDPEAHDRFSALARARGIAAFRHEWLKHPLLRLTTDNPDMHQLLWSMIERYSGRDLLATAVTADAGLDGAQLQAFSVPTLVITGERDSSDRVESADLLAKRLPHAERATIPGAGHLPNLDNPTAYNATLSQYLGRYATASS
jgi:3-oxoadipate enol-lactonase